VDWLDNEKSYDELLHGPRYFDCKKGNCRLRVEICLGRQKANEHREPFKPLPYGICENCEQGKQNQSPEGPNKGSKGKPKRGKGKRLEHCPFYADCLGVVAKKKAWRTWNCEGCIHYNGNEVMTEKQENTRVCKCGKNKTITPKHELCSSCLGKKAWSKSGKKRAAKKRKKAVVKAKKKDKGSDKDKQENAPQVSDTALTALFGKHAQTLKEIAKIAESEMRPVAMQIIYMLRKALNNTHEAG